MHESKSQKLLTIELQTPNGGPIFGQDLGVEFLRANGITDLAAVPVAIQVIPKKSQAGNLFYTWDQNGIPLPDGLATRLVVNDCVLQQGIVRQSKNGNEMRKDAGEILIDDCPYVVSALIVRTRRPYWVKVLAHRAPGRRRVS